MVRGPNVTQGYLNQPEVNAATFAAAGSTPATSGRADDAGNVYLLDRKKDMMITGGENVYSSEVEQAIYQHPGVSECAVIGVPHPTWGEALVAVVVPAPANASLTDAAMIEHCRAPDRRLQDSASMAIRPRIAEERNGQDPQDRATP